MNRKVVDDIKDFFESYELMDKLIDHSKYVSAIKVNIFHNEKKQALDIKVVERAIRSKAQRRMFQSMGMSNGDNLFCDFRLNYNKVKFTFKLNQDHVKRFHEEVKLPMQKKYKCHYHGTTVYVEFYNPKLQDIMDIFTAFEPICKRVLS